MWLNPGQDRWSKLRIRTSQYETCRREVLSLRMLGRPLSPAELYLQYQDGYQCLEWAAKTPRFAAMLRQFVLYGDFQDYDSF